MVCTRFIERNAPENTACPVLINLATGPMAEDAFNWVLFEHVPRVINESNDKVSPLLILTVFPAGIDCNRLKWLLFTNVTAPAFKRNSL